MTEDGEDGDDGVHAQAHTKDDGDEDGRVFFGYEGRCGQTGGTQRIQQRGSLLLAAVRQDLEARPAKNQWPEHHSAGGHEPVEERRRRSAPGARRTAG